MNECDEKFWEEDLNDLGNAFASEYYGLDDVGQYMLLRFAKVKAQGCIMLSVLWIITTS